MPVIQLVITLIVLGLIMWLVNTYIPMPPPVKTVINVVIVLAICLWLLSAFGIGNYVIPVRR
jgi:uncharacterized BrkB/YihY/UPF0761 family membrane protein